MKEPVASVEEGIYWFDCESLSMCTMFSYFRIFKAFRLNAIIIFKCPYLLKANVFVLMLIYFLLFSVPEYQIVHVEHLTSVKTSRHVTRDNIMEEAAVFKIRAFNEDIHVEVNKAEESFTNQATTCVYLEADGTEREEAIPRGCYYEGKVQGVEQSMVSVSTCAGIVSVFKISTTLFSWKNCV